MNPFKAAEPVVDTGEIDATLEARVEKLAAPDFRSVLAIISKTADNKDADMSFHRATQRARISTQVWNRVDTIHRHSEALPLMSGAVY